MFIILSQSTSVPLGLVVALLLIYVLGVGRGGWGSLTPMCTPKYSLSATMSYVPTVVVYASVPINTNVYIIVTSVISRIDIILLVAVVSAYLVTTLFRPHVASMLTLTQVIFPPETATFILLMSVKYIVESFLAVMDESEVLCPDLSPDGGGGGGWPCEYLI